MKNYPLSLAVILSLFLFSCKKESLNNEQPSELKGEWKLMQIEADGKTSSIVSSDLLGTMTGEVLMDYVTINNKGSMSFDNGTMKTINVQYDVTGSITMKQFIDEEPITTFDSTLNIPMPESSSAGEYIQVSADSLYCPNGSIVQVQGAEDYQSKPVGVKLKYEGDKLILTMRQKDTTVETDEDMTREDKIDVTLVITLQKQ
jgi:hypothetical protein